MSFLVKALGGAAGIAGGSGASPAAAAAEGLKPELLGSIRVAVVGEPSVGKTALTELIASGRPVRSVSTRSTAGCHIHVTLVDSSSSSSHHAGGAGMDSSSSRHDSISSTPGSAGASAAAVAGGHLPAQQKFFVELWDVSGQPKYSALRSVFFKQLNGVILVYDVTNRASLARLTAWASEVAQDGSFAAPLADELAARNVGGLPVPVLVVGNKADRLGFASHLGAAGAADSVAAFLNSVCAQALLQGSAACGAWPQRLLHRLTRGAFGGGTAPPSGVGRPPSEASMAAAAAEAGLEAHLLGLTASAAAGDLDWARLHGFFRGLWERRYAPAAAAAAAAAAAGGIGGIGWGGAGVPSHHRHTLSGAMVGLPAGAAAAALTLPGGDAGYGGGLSRGAAAAAADDADARLDDNWV